MVKMTSISKLIVLIIFGAFFGAIMLLFVGGLHREFLTMMDPNFMVAYSNPVEYIFVFIYSSIISILLGMLSVALFWVDCVLFSAVLGALTVHFFFTTKEWAIVIQTSSPKKFGMGILIVILACGIFFLQRQANANAILGRYVEFCSAIQKHNDEAAYAYMSPEYHQNVSLNEFKKVVQKKLDYDRSLTDVCSQPVSSKWDVSIWGNTSIFSDPGNFLDPFAYKVFCYFKNVNNEWYLNDVPSQGGGLD